MVVEFAAAVVVVVVVGSAIALLDVSRAEVAAAVVRHLQAVLWTWVFHSLKWDKAEVGAGAVVVVEAVVGALKLVSQEPMASCQTGCQHRVRSAVAVASAVGVEVASLVSEFAC